MREKSARLSAASDTSAMSAMFDKLETPIEEFVAAFSPVEHQVGAMFFINGAQAGLELFDAASTWRKLAPKLVRSYAVDAIDRRGRPSRKRAPHAPMAFATAVGSTPASVFPAIGEGNDVRLSWDRRHGRCARGWRSRHPSECVSCRRSNRVTRVSEHEEGAQRIQRWWATAIGQREGYCIRCESSSAWDLCHALTNGRLAVVCGILDDVQN